MERSHSKRPLCSLGDLGLSECLVSLHVGRCALHLSVLSGTQFSFVSVEFRRHSIALFSAFLSNLFQKSANEVEFRTQSIPLFSAFPSNLF